MLMCLTVCTVIVLNIARCIIKLTNDKEKHRLHYNNVEMQSGQVDCDLFAIPFATALMNGLHPGAYYIDPSVMPSH